MEATSSCVEDILPLIHAFITNNFPEIETIAERISKKEHDADILKNEMRNNLPKSIFLSFNKQAFTNIIESQDAIADIAEDISVIVSLRPLRFIPELEPSFSIFVQKNIDTFRLVYKMIQELPCLTEGSFIGIEAEKIKLMTSAVAEKEHEVDLIQRDVIKKLFLNDTLLTPSMFHQWNKLFETIGALSNASERLALAIRYTIDAF